MPLINEAPQIVEALKHLPGVAAVHRGWPKTWEALPCIAVAEAGNTPLDFRDGVEYMDELEYYVRVFAIKAEQIDVISAALVGTAEAPGPMVLLGYRRTFSWDDDNQDIRQKVLRFKKVV